MRFIKRIEDNHTIITMVEIYLKQNPGMRLNQALINLSVVAAGVDDFYTEPVDILIRMRKGGS